jgi:hypothetical protein
VKYIDDVFYAIGWVCVIACCFGFDWRLGMAVTGIACGVTSILLAKWGGGKQ